MDGFLLALSLAMATALGAREQVLVARLSDALGRSIALLATAVASAVTSAALMAWLGARLAPLLPPVGACVLIVAALGRSALELAAPVQLRPLREPTRSLGAIGLVLFARQIGDAARFVLLALAAAAYSSPAVALGGAVAGSAAAVLGWWAGAARLECLRLGPLRLPVAAGTILAAGLFALNASFGGY